MPLVNISLLEGKDPSYLDELSNGIHEALMETWEIPLLDKFHIITEKKKAHFKIDKKMWGVGRSDDVVVLQITTSPRTKAMKLAFYERLPAILNAKIGLNPGDVFVSVTTIEKEDWTFGNGMPQLLEE